MVNKRWKSSAFKAARTFFLHLRALITFVKFHFIDKKDLTTFIVFFGSLNLLFVGYSAI